MNVSLFCFWLAAVELVAPKLTAPESAALLMIAATILVFRTFRERYLLIWTVGWLAYFVSRWAARDPGLVGNSSLSTAASQASFVLAVCLLAAAILLYSNAKKFLMSLGLVALVLAGYAVARALLWPDVAMARVPLEVGYRLVLLGTAAQILRSRWGRWEVGPFLMAPSLLCLHLDWAPYTTAIPAGVWLMADLLVGVSMLFVVFDDSRLRTKRLRVINSLTGAMARAQQHGPMMQTALEELKQAMGAKGVWFRVVESDRGGTTHHVGISPDFVKATSLLGMDANIEKALHESKPSVIAASQTMPAVQAYLQDEGFHHIVLVPVPGKKSMIGTLGLGKSSAFTYTLEDLNFLQTAAHQLAMAVDNVKLLEQVSRSQRQWMNTFDSVQDAILAHDAEFVITKANQSFVMHLQDKNDDVVGSRCEDVLPHEFSTWTGCPYCARGDADFVEGPDPCFGGFSMVSTSSYVEQGGQQKGTIHVIRDTTDRRSAEERYRLLFEQVQEGVFVATPEGKLLDCNDAFVRMLGYENRQELMALNINQELYVSPEQRQAFRSEIELHNSVRNFEVTLRRKDGAHLAAAETSFATRDNAGKVARYQGFLLDVSEKKRAEDDMRRRNRELNALNAMAVIATQSFDLDEILNLTLRQVVSLFGAEGGSIYLCDADDVTFRRRAGWGQRSEQRGKFSAVEMKGGFGELVMRSRTEVLTREFLPHLPKLVVDFIQADGTPSWLWVLLWSKDSPIGIMGVSSREAREYSQNDESLMVAIGRQLATTIEKVRLYEETCKAYEDLRRTQEQLLQSEKMSAVGQLIAGVAHELNNPLTAILGYAQLLESEGLNERASDFVRKLFKQAQRTHRVVQNLLSFARERKPQKQEVDLRRVVEDTLSLRDYDLRVNNIVVEKDIPADVPSVTADSHQLEQVFLNIINNAVDAILEVGKSGGKLKVRVRIADGQVGVEFLDSGVGIKDPNRIFDPFYTTKSVGKGTGLGMSICYGIIKEHGGDITAHNRPEGGAAIEVRLPASGRFVETDAAGAPTRRESAIEGRILLVEDEEAVLEFERDVLVGAGAQVVTALTNDEAKGKLRAEAFDAVIMNGRMPGGWGAAEAHRWIRAASPGLENRVLFTFSTVADQEARNYLQKVQVPTLVKPFEVAELIAHARRLLQKTQAAAAR
jgi:two-component system NtrC family sensor kinase